MIPLRDNIPSRTTPWVNYVIIAVCGFVFFFQLQDDRSELVERYGMIPTRVTHPDEPLEIVEQYIVRTPVGDQLETVRRPALPVRSPSLANTADLCISTRQLDAHYREYVDAVDLWR